MAAARARLATGRRTPTTLAAMVEMSAVVTVWMSRTVEATATTATAVRLPMVSRARVSRVVVAVGVPAARVVPVRVCGACGDVIRLGEGGR
jgi:hypothetical protein